MTVGQWALAAWGVLGSAVWIAVFVRALRSIVKLPRLRDVVPATDLESPSVSVVIPARNEAGSIGATLDSILSQDHPDLEIVVVDDRSTDGTGRILDRRAAGDPRVRPIRLDSLPDGWLGKVHALERGTGEAGGEWLLFTDADVRLTPDAVRLALARAEQERLDHLAVTPRVEPPTMAMRVAVVAFGLFGLARSLVHADPEAGEAFGVGAFNLVRRSAFERTPGFAWLRLEPVDDVGLARMIAAAGGRSSLVAGQAKVWLAWYPGLRAMVRGLEKNAFAFAARYRYRRAVAVSIGFLFLGLSPVAAVFAPVAAVRWLGVFDLALLAGCAVVGHRRLGLPRLPALAAPIGITILAWTIVWSAYRAWRRGGIEWSGRTYPLEELRARQRVWIERWI